MEPRLGGALPTAPPSPPSPGELPGIGSFSSSRKDISSMRETGWSGDRCPGSAKGLGTGSIFPREILERELGSEETQTGIQPDSFWQFPLPIRTPRFPWVMETDSELIWRFSRAELPGEAPSRFCDEGSFWRTLEKTFQHQ